MGPERKTRVISEKEKRTVAYHEAGHAVVGYYLENVPPIHKITIVSRGQAGGFVMPLPESDSFLISREQFEDQIAFGMGGRAAEEIVFNQLTTGASDDLQKATRRARAMVTQFGMSTLLGPRAYGSNNGSIFLGREIGEQRDYSEQYAEEIDNEVKRILEANYTRAKNILNENRDKLEMIAAVLIEQETLDRQNFEELMQGETPGISTSAPAPAMFDTDSNIED